LRFTNYKMCKMCNLKPVYEFTNKRKLCKNCFIHWFEKKILYTIRKYKMIQRGDIVGYFKSKHFRSVVLEEILNMIEKHIYVKIKKLPKIKDTLTKTVDRLKVDKLVLSSSLDLTAYHIVNEVINGDVENLDYIFPVEKLGKKSKIINPLYLFLDREILLYAKLKKLKFKVSKVRKDKIEKFIDKLEEKHPEIKRAIVKGYLRTIN